MPEHPWKDTQGLETVAVAREGSWGLLTKEGRTFAFDRIPFCFF